MTRREEDPRVIRILNLFNSGQVLQDDNSSCQEERGKLGIESKPYQVSYLY